MDLEQWRNFFESSVDDIWTIIEQAIIVAHTNYHVQLRTRRDWFTELMYAPYLAHTTRSDEVLSKGSDSDKTNAISRESKTKEVEEDGKREHRSKDEDDDEAANVIGQIDSSNDEVGNDNSEIDVMREDNEAAWEEVHGGALDGDYHYRLRVQRDWFTERMDGPYLAHRTRSDEVLSKGSDSGKTNAVNEVSKTNAVEENNEKSEESSKDEHNDEAVNEFVQIDSSKDEHEEEAANEFVQSDSNEHEHENEAANEFVQVDREDEHNDEAANEFVQIDSSEDEHEEEAANEFVQSDSSEQEQENEVANESVQIDPKNTRSATASSGPLYIGLVNDSEKREGSKRKLLANYMSAKKQRTVQQFQ